MKTVTVRRLFCLALAVISILFVAGTSAAEKRIPVKLEGKKILPLRVLSKPFATIYANKDIHSEIVEENVPAFRSFHVYTRPTAADEELGEGWYEVGGDNRGNVIGWMKQDDVFEWKQALCLAYTHPLGRQPVLMFESRKFSRDLVEKPQEDRQAAVEQLYSSIENGDISEDFPVISIEPKKAVDISEEFYLLPILEYENIEIENREGRLLKLAAVTNSSATAREESDIRTNKAYLNQANEANTKTDIDKIKEMKVDLVWVIDTTASMQNYIDKTLEVVQEISERIGADEEVKNAVKFGVWGYRDSSDEIKGMEYTTKNYTQELQSIDTFIPELSKVQAVNVSSQGYEEDMFSGMTDAIDKTQWTEDAMHFIILVGDAPSHPAGDKRNLSGQNENSLHNLAIDRKIYISAIHLKNPKAEKFHELAETQMRTLATNPGVEEESYYDMDSSDLEQFKTISAHVSNEISDTIKNIFQTVAEKQAEIARQESDATETEEQNEEVAVQGEQTSEEIVNNENAVVDDFATPSENEEDVDIETIISSDENSENDAASQMVKAAVVQWLGSQARTQAPRDITAWAIDKDFTDPSISSMEVRLLLTKRQLDTLYQVLTSVLAAGQQGQISGGDFFDALQSTAATAARDPELLKKAKNMASAGLVPEFLEGLPYHSQLMDMSNELWNSWSVDEQNDFLNNLEAIIEAYKTIHDSPEGWIQLNPGDDADMAVYPLALDLLP